MKHGIISLGLITLLLLVAIPFVNAAGTVSITADKSETYLGETVTFSGTNTDSSKTYLFISGPNMDQTRGSNIQAKMPRLYPVTLGDESTFKIVIINPDNTWSWSWDTSKFEVDEHPYTIYAVSTPTSMNYLANTTYGKTTLILKKTLLTAEISASEIEVGNKISFIGKAPGYATTEGVAIWIIGETKRERKVIIPNSNGDFTTEFDTSGFPAGQYDIIVQNPAKDGFGVKETGCMTDGSGNIESSYIPSVCQYQVAGTAQRLGWRGCEFGNPCSIDPLYTETGKLSKSDATAKIKSCLNYPQIDDLTKSFTLTIKAKTTPITSVPTTVLTTAIITTIVPTSSQTTAVNATPTTAPITTLMTTVVTSPSSTFTTLPTNSVNKLLEEQNKKIEEQNKRLADLNKTITEQNQKLSEQNDILTQIINFLKGMFGWK